MTDMVGSPLDPLLLPLQGSHLIEASAGTGKTWTIAALYLRLVLGHGSETTRPPASFASGTHLGSSALSPAEILVMTFTRAATRELSDRIRERLHHAALCFRGEEAPAPDDSFLQRLMADYAEGPPRQAAAWRLALAAESMDDAAVHTIDAWCQRMLTEHAFDSAQWVDEDVLANEAELRTRASHDHWRREVYPLRGELLDEVLKTWPTVHDLVVQVGPLLNSQETPDGSSVAPQTVSLGTCVAHVLAQRAARLHELKQGWDLRVDAMQAWLEAQLAKKQIDGRKFASHHRANWLTALRTWSADAALVEPKLTDTAKLRLTPAGVQEAVKPGCAVDVPPVFEELAALLIDLQHLPNPTEALLRHAAHGIRVRLDELKRRAGLVGFGDLQSRLDRALSGPQGEHLRQRMRAQMPVALIDEFQDTSPLQYRLFDQLYGVAANDPRSALLLIGDPKQAIYSFRGADIYSYLQARLATQGRHHVLGTNFRSTPRLVSAVNTLFDSAEQAWPGGAFGFGAKGGLRLPFEPVAARGRKERFVAGAAAGVGGAPADAAALTVQLLPEPLGATDLRSLLARHAAAQIVALLNDPGAGFIASVASTADVHDGLTPGTGSFRRLAPSDMAVLVRDRNEAAVLRAELRRRGVASVYLSDQESVFQSAEAEDLLRWLQAVAAPLDALLVRAAFATRMAGLSLAEMAALVHDETAWEQRLAQLQQLRGIWQRYGVLPLVRHSLHALDLPARCLGAATAPADGERCLTNLLHLGELLQQASAQLDGEQAQIRWLTEQILQAVQGAADERVVRLESDAELVQVVTVHKSKGLEYPLVFVPFASSFRAVTKQRRKHLELIDEATGAHRLDFTLDAAACEAADRERLREDLRLMYVALTRARHAVWLGVGLPKPRYGRSGPGAGCELHKSALGYLLGGGAVMEPQGVLQALEQLCAMDSASDPGIALDLLELPPARTALQRPQIEPPLQPAPQPAQRIEREWRIGSFSGLVRDLGGATVTADAAGASEAREASDAPRGSRLQELIREVDPFGSGVDAVVPGLKSDVIVSDFSDFDAPHPAGAFDEGLPSAAALPAPRGGRPTEALAPWHRFARGALAGNFLHDQLEWLAEEGFDHLDSEPGQAQLRRRCERQGHGAAADDVVAWMQAVTAQTLPALGVPLRSLAVVLPEMEFWMPAAASHSAELDAICRRFYWPGRARPALLSRPMQGLLMGFADLVFEHDGRYWVLDYKSNALAPAELASSAASSALADAAYHAEALADAMLAHRYDLQAALYLLALHRLLRSRLGAAYDPARQLGGAVYLFLRGIDGPVSGCVTLEAPLPLLDALEACLGDTAASLEQPEGAA